MRTKFEVLFLLTLWAVSSDAWFWEWTGTTTFPPTVDQEGSGSPAGSGEPPSDNIASVAAKIIDKGHGIQNIVQTWDEKTEGHRLTPATQLENDRESEKGTAGISSRIRKPGNGTSSLKGRGSGGSDHLAFAGDVSGLGSGLESKLASGTELGLGSGSGFISESGSTTGSETSWGARFENPQGVEMPTNHMGLGRGGSAVSQTNEMELQNSARVINHSTDEGHNLGSRKSEQRLDLSVETSNNARVNRKLNSSSSWNANNLNLTKDSHEISTLGDLITPIVGNNYVETTQAPKDVSQLPAGEFTTNQQTLSHQVLQTRPDSFASQALSTTQTPTPSPQMFITQPQTARRKPDTTSISGAAQFQVPSPASETSQKVMNSQIDQHLEATQSSVNEQGPRQATVIRPTTVSGWAPAESHTEVAKSALSVKPPQCLLLDTALPFCSSMVGERFVVPNYLNQSSVEEVQVLLNEWAWLLKSPCHHSLEWFFCVLLVPKCSSLAPLPVLPCRSFCEVLRDSCWALLDEGRLPVECHTLPDEEDDGYRCLSVSNQKGNHWFK